MQQVSELQTASSFFSSFAAQQAFDDARIIYLSNEQPMNDEEANDEATEVDVLLEQPLEALLVVML